MQKGIKYDKDKPRLAEMFIDFKEPILKMYEVWEFGANKYGLSNWKSVEEGKKRFTNALIRHLFAEDENLYDDETKLLHASHVAFNAFARLKFVIDEIRKKEVK